MKQNRHRLLANILMPMAFTAIASFAQKSIDLNMGFTASKSILGLSYTHDTHQIAGGLHGFSFSSREGWHVTSGIAYNRYLTASGFYATAIYSFSYVDLRNESLVPADVGWTYVTDPERGWVSEELMVGIGKSFQFTRWGLHLDGGLSTPATSRISRAWGWWFGAGASRRFRLG